MIRMFLIQKILESGKHNIIVEVLKMANNFDREFDRAPALSDWLQNFAEQQLKNAGNADFFKKKNDLDAVEAMVSELRKRVGLDLINEETVKTAINKKEAEELVGGLGDGKKDSDFDPEQLEKGIEVEKEHSPDITIRKEIAKDHLMESDKYYDYLEKMEEEMDKEAKVDFVEHLVSLANSWEEIGNIKLAQKIDSLICKISEDLNSEEDIIKKHPKIEKFIKAIITTRGGFIDTPALLEMAIKTLSEIAPSLKLKEKDREVIREFIEKNKKETVKEKYNDVTEGVELTMSIQDAQENYDVFGKG